MSFGGTATNEQKETALDWFGNASKCYSGHVVARIKPVRYDVTLAEGDQKGKVVLVCETTIEEDMTNGFGIAHGGCSAFLIDICTTVALTALSPLHVTLNLDIICHAPAMQGTIIEIVSMSTVVGSRVLGTRCESSQGNRDRWNVMQGFLLTGRLGSIIYEKDTRKLLISGHHLKMPYTLGLSKL